MPELPEVERARRQLEPAMTGARFERVILNRRGLRQPFAGDFVARLSGQTVRALTRRGKYLVVELSSADRLIVHLGMSGSFRIEPSAREERQRHDHVVFHMSSQHTVTFNDPRRFGVMQLTAAGAPARTGVDRLGPEPLSAAFDARTVAGWCAGRRTPLKGTLLDQRMVAGLGNIYASEALHLARLSPLRRASTIATSTGRPRPAALRLAAAIKAVLRRALALKDSNLYRGNRFRVYDREGERCPTAGCHGTIRRVWQAGRSTFYCPVCQR